MLLDDVDPAEREAWGEVEQAERELELAQLRLMAIKERCYRRSRRHLRVVPLPSGEPCDARR
jgi:hypothetical protein